MGFNLGDSGGPLYVLDTVPDQNGTDVQKYIEIGVVSYGPGCANAGYPGYIFLNFSLNIFDFY